jgi:hypothetical protein
MRHIFEQAGLLRKTNFEGLNVSSGLESCVYLNRGAISFTDKMGEVASSVEVEAKELQRRDNAGLQPGDDV